MTDMRDESFTMRHSKVNPCPPVRLVDGEVAVALPEMRRTRLGKKVEAHAALQITAGFGPQHGLLAVIACAAGLAPEQYRRQVKVPSCSSAIKMLQPQIDAAVATAAEGETAGRIAQPAKSCAHTVKPGPRLKPHFGKPCPVGQRWPVAGDDVQHHPPLLGPVSACQQAVPPARLP